MAKTYLTSVEVEVEARNRVRPFLEKRSDGKLCFTHKGLLAREIQRIAGDAILTNAKTDNMETVEIKGVDAYYEPNRDDEQGRLEGQAESMVTRFDTMMERVANGTATRADALEAAGDVEKAEQVRARGEEMLGRLEDASEKAGERLNKIVEITASQLEKLRAVARADHRARHADLGHAGGGDRRRRHADHVPSLDDYGRHRRDGLRHRFGQRPDHGSRCGVAGSGTDRPSRRSSGSSDRR